jgi:hypothetical protein
VLLFHRYVPAKALARPLWWLRQYQSSPLLELVQCAGRINAWRSSDELNYLLKLDGAELGHNLADAALKEQQTSRDDGFGHALSGGPAHIVCKQISAAGAAPARLVKTRLRSP